MESAVGSGPPGSAGFASRINTGPPPPWGRDRVAGVFLGAVPWWALARTWRGCGDVGASSGPIPHPRPLPFVRSRFQDTMVIPMPLGSIQPRSTSRSSRAGSESILLAPMERKIRSPLPSPSFLPVFGFFFKFL